MPKLTFGQIILLIIVLGMVIAGLFMVFTTASFMPGAGFFFYAAIIAAFYGLVTSR